MCRRRYQQNTCAYLRQRQRGCCSSHRNCHSIYSDYYCDINDTTLAIEPRRNTSPGVYTRHSEPPTPQTKFPYVRGHSSMAAALILGLSLGMQKIQEKREKKKEKKTLMEFADEQRESKLRTNRVSRNREQGERRRSESLEREDKEAPPPSYEEVVGESARRSGR